MASVRALRDTGARDAVSTLVEVAPRKVGTDAGFECGFGQVVLFQDGGIGRAVELTRSALKGPHLGDLLGDCLIADGNADARGLIVEGGLIDQRLDDLLIDPEGERRVQRNLRAELRTKRIDFLTQGARIIPGVDVLFAHGADGAAATDWPETVKLASRELRKVLDGIVQP